MTQADIEYKKLVERVLSEGVVKGDRTGTGTMQVFGHMSRYDCKNDRLPLLTTKNVHFKSVLYELLWFLRGDTNIQYLCKNGVTIWDEWPYKQYVQSINKDIDNQSADASEIVSTEHGLMRAFDIKEFAKHIAEDDLFAKKYGDIGKVYGKQWVRWEAVTGNKMIPSGNHAIGATEVPVVEEINQLKNAIQTLKSNPDSRRILVSAWYPGQVEKASLPPCHYMYQFCSTVMDPRERINAYIDQCKQAGIIPDLGKMEEELELAAFPTRKLSLLFNMRSVDIGLGWPFDIASFGILLAMVARYTNHVTNEVIIASADTHIYLNHVEPLKEQMQRTGFPDQPWMKINTANAPTIFDLKFEDFELVGYKRDAPIKMDISV